MNSLLGKLAIVTGASKGIGKAIAIAYGREGADVVAVGRCTESLLSVAEALNAMGRRAMAITADLGVDGEVLRIVDETLAGFGRIDILVNNAAIIHRDVDLVDFDIALWRQVIGVNLVSVALLTKAVLPSMIARRTGKIINISSIGGRKGARHRSAYRASKAGLISLTESVAAEVSPYGVDVNCICPGGVDTEGYRVAFRSKGKAEDPNLMDPSEIAQLAVFLASDASSAVTGSAIDAFGRNNPLFS